MVLKVHILCKANSKFVNMLYTYSLCACLIVCTYVMEYVKAAAVGVAAVKKLSWESL
jgi:hypothetical protein